MPPWFINPQGTVRSGWKLLGFIVVFWVLGILVALLGSALQVPPFGYALSVWLNAALVALASFLCVRLEQRSFCDLGLRLSARWWAELAAGTLGGGLLILLMAGLIHGLDGFHWTRAAAVGPRQAAAGAALFLGVAVNEELLSRGFPFQRLVEGAGPWVGQLAFAAFFAVGHWGNPGMHGATKVWATINIGLAAVLLGFCYLRTRRLALPIGVHLGWNWVQGSLLGFGVSGTTEAKGHWEPVFHDRPEWLTGEAFGLEASLICTLVCAAAILLVWRWRGSAATADVSTASES